MYLIMEIGMKALLKNRLFVINVSITFLFAFASLLSAQSHSLAGEKLIKPSTIDLENDEVASEESNAAQAALQEQPLAKPELDFMKNLQANIGSISLPANPSVDQNNANTWIPKFVWLGDIQKDDELKCFAAFLIGSLADQNNTSKSISPGVFMTPVTTSTNVTTSSISPLPATTAIETQSLVTRQSSNTPPPPTPVQSRMFTELQTGLGFLYFAGVHGNLSPQPAQLFTSIALSNYPVKGKIEYNRTPVFTFDLGWNLTNWLSCAATLQCQQNIHIRTKPLQFAGRTIQPLAEDTFAQVNFQSFLDLYSIGGKILLNWSNLLRFSGWKMGLFIGGSCAAGWQSWTEVQAIQTYFNSRQDVLTNASISFRDKYFANFSYTGDSGVVFKPTNIFAKMSIRLGCKFIGWGAARGLGALKDQKDIKRLTSSNAAFGSTAIYSNYFKPFRIKTIYSWTPYVGINWDF